MYFEKIINLVRSGCSLSLLLVKALNFNLVLFKWQRYNFIQYKSIKSDYFVRCLWVNASRQGIYLDGVCQIPWSVPWMLGLQCRLRHWNRWAPNLHLR